jgi:hypothetical protein
VTWRIVGALILIAVGVLFLLINFGLIPPDIWNYVLPLILILAGVGLFIGFRRQQPVPVVDDSDLLEGATSASILIKHGAGRLSIDAGQDPTLLFSGSFIGGIKKSLTHENGTARVELSIPSDSGAVRSVSVARLISRISLNSRIPISLRYEGGAAETTMDLSLLNLSALEIHTGASSTDILLPVPNGTLRVTSSSGAASVKFRVPAAVPAMIRAPTRLGALQVDLARFPSQSEGIYQSEGYDTAADRIELSIEGGIGSVEIR